MKIKTNWNSKDFPKDYEVNHLPSMTVPGQSMTVPEILTRYASGLSIGAMNVPIYNGDDDLWNGINPETLDLAEVENIIKARREQMDTLKKSVVKDVAERRRKAKEFQAKEIQRQVAEQVARQKETYNELRGKYDTKTDS